MTLPAGRGHWGLTHWKPPPVLMQVVPLVQLSWDRAHSSMSARQGRDVGQTLEETPPRASSGWKRGKSTSKWLKRHRIQKAGGWLKTPRLPEGQRGLRAGGQFENIISRCLLNIFETPAIELGAADAEGSIRGVL